MSSRKSGKANPEDAKADQIWSVYLDCSESLLLERKTPSKILVEIESLIETAERNLTERVKTCNTSGSNLRDSWLATFWGLKGYCLGVLGRADEANNAFERSVTLDPTNAHHHEDFIYFLISINRYDEAAKRINAISQATIESENDSTAIKILQWACAHVEISKRIDPGLLKHCVALLSKYGSTVILESYAAKPNSTKVNGAESEKESQ